MLKRSRLAPSTKPLVRKAPLATRRSASAAQRRAYQEVDEASNGCCFSCKEWGPTDHSHILPQGMNKLLRANPLNILPECRRCHTLWHDKLPEYARRYPEALTEKVARMKQLDRERWALWMMKNDYLLK